MQYNTTDVNNVYELLVNLQRPGKYRRVLTGLMRVEEANEVYEE